MRNRHLHPATRTATRPQPHFLLREHAAGPVPECGSEWGHHTTRYDIASRRVGRYIPPLWVHFVEGALLAVHGMESHRVLEWSGGSVDMTLTVVLPRACLALRAKNFCSTRGQTCDQDLCGPCFVKEAKEANDRARGPHAASTAEFDAAPDRPPTRPSPVAATGLAAAPTSTAPPAPGGVPVAAQSEARGSPRVRFPTPPHHVCCALCARSPWSFSVSSRT
jgi:hypothetical protein